MSGALNSAHKAGLFLAQEYTHTYTAHVHHTHTPHTYTTHVHYPSHPTHYYTPNPALGLPPDPVDPEINTITTTDTTTDTTTTTAAPPTRPHGP